MNAPASPMATAQAHDFNEFKPFGAKVLVDHKGGRHGQHQ